MARKNDELAPSGPDWAKVTQLYLQSDVELTPRQLSVLTGIPEADVKDALEALGLPGRRLLQRAASDNAETAIALSGIPLDALPEGKRERLYGEWDQRHQEMLNLLYQEVRRRLKAPDELDATALNTLSTILLRTVQTERKLHGRDSVAPHGWKGQGGGWGAGAHATAVGPGAVAVAMNPTEPQVSEETRLKMIEAEYQVVEETPEKSTYPEEMENPE